MFKKILIIVVFLIILLSIFLISFKNTTNIQYNLIGGKQELNYEIFQVKQQFFNQGENIYILDETNEITSSLSKLFSKEHLNWSFGYVDEAIKFNPTYIITNPDVSKEKVNDLLKYTFINQIYIINSKFLNFDYDSKLYLIQISNTEDIIYGRNNPIYYVSQENLDKLFNTLSFAHLGKSIYENYYPPIINKLFLVKFKYLNINSSLTVLNNGLNDWCRKKNKTLKLSELQFIGQGYFNVCVKIPHYNYLLRISLKQSPSIDPVELNEDKIQFLKKYGPSPIVVFHDYKFNPPHFRWMEVEECKPIKPFDNFKEFINYDQHKLKQLLIKAKKLFNNRISDRKINNSYVDFYSWYDLNMGNIMINKNGEYVIVDIDFTTGKNWKLIDSSLETTLNKNITAHNLIGTKPLADNETYTLLHYILKEHKHEYINNKIIEYFLIKLNYLRFLENQKLDKQISNTTDNNLRIELKNKFNVITKAIVDNLINENFNQFPDSI